MASRAGRSKPSRELTEIKDLLKILTDRVIFTEGTEYLPANHAAVAGQLINTRLRAVEMERKIKETEEFEARLERLEEAAERGRDARRVG
ncbi:MAG: hypothetical protein WKF53_09920 [Rubrobacter sp.]